MPSECSWKVTCCGDSSPSTCWPPVIAGRVVIEDLVGDVGAGGDRLADRKAAGVEVGAVAEIGEHVLFLGERRDADPRHALASHVGVGLGAAIHPQGHEVTADAGKGPATFGHLGRSVCADSPSRNTACG